MKRDWLFTVKCRKTSTVLNGTGYYQTVERNYWKLLFVLDIKGKLHVSQWAPDKRSRRNRACNLILLPATFRTAASAQLYFCTPPRLNIFPFLSFFFLFPHLSNNRNQSICQMLGSYELFLKKLLFYWGGSKLFIGKI